MPPSSFVIQKPVTAVLGPTNTGKTHFALDRMSAHPSGMIGLPLRLLAREVYDRMVARKGARAVALVTGEEKITPNNPSYWVCTVEAMPLERQTSFLAIDEVQLAADAERGRVFTDRILSARGRNETLLLGSDTMRPILDRLIPDLGHVSRERFSTLEYQGHRKITRLPRRSAIVAFSSDSVYSIAELIRRQRGGAAVVMGALSPRTRNAQAALYNEGEVDYLVATDAIGMGLNMDIDHVAFAAASKFDGRGSRMLMPAEVGQIAGRAGRHVRDGTWGTTGDCDGLPEMLIEQVENHRFDPVTALQWRSPHLEFTSLPALLHSLDTKPPRPELVRSRTDDDEEALRRLIRRPDVAERARGGAALKLLWEVCQIPDFRKVTADQHAQMLHELWDQLISDGQIRQEYVATALSRLDRLEGDVDTLSARIAHVRTWTYLSHRPGWLPRAPHWQEEARRIEDALSDRLHDALTQRFIDRRTSVLLKKLKDDAPLLAGVAADGDVIVEGEFVGRLLGFQFILDPRAKGAHAKAVRFAALKALKPELAARAAALSAAGFHEFSLRDGGAIWWRQSIVARLVKGPQPLRPDFRLMAMEHLPASAVPLIEDRVRDYVAERVEGLIGPLVSLQKAANLVSESPEALGAGGRGIAFRLVENFGALSRHVIADEVKALAQEERAKLRNLGVRFGEYTIYLPGLLKPAPAQFLALLWALWEGKDPETIRSPQAGATSIANDRDRPAAYYLASGYRPSGNKAVRIDMLERLAGEIRTAREASGREGFEATSRMMSLVGCSGEDFEAILQSLGFRKVTIDKQVPKRAVTLRPRNDGDAAAAPATDGAATDAPMVEEVTAAAAAPADASAEASVEAIVETVAEAGGEASVAASAEPAADAATGIAAEAPAAEPVEMETISVSVWRWTPPRAKPEGEGQRRRPARRNGPSAGPMEEGASVGPAVDGAPGGRSERGGQDNRRRGHRGGQSGDNVAARERPADGENRGGRRHDGKSRDGQGRDGQPREGQQARDGQRREGPRPEGQRGEGPRQDHGGRGDRRDHKGGYDRRGGKPDDRGPRTFSSGPQRDRREPDPDSPFAILAALKLKE